MICRTCGSELPSGSDFCPICGAWNIPVETSESGLDMKGAVLTNEEYLALESQALRDLEDFTEAYTGELEASLSPQELEEVKVVTPETIARWRAWGVPEEIIERIIRQKARIREIRLIEERTTVPGFAYTMPKLPEVEARDWGVAKIWDAEGHIYPRKLAGKNKIRRIDRWLYRREYVYPELELWTTTYNLTEEIANMIHAEVIVSRRIIERRAVLGYLTATTYSRAVRMCYLMEPNLKVPHKLASAREILATYRRHPSLKIR